LNIKGVADGDKKSTIDMNKHSGFDVASGAELNVNNTQIKNAVGTVCVNSGATASFNNVDFVGNTAKLVASSSYLGGAIFNNVGNVKAISGNFVGNSAQGSSALGGAIYTTADLKLVADNKALEIRDNYTMSNGVKDDNAIYVAKSNAKLTFDIKNNGSILLKDNVFKFM